MYIIYIIYMHIYIYTYIRIRIRTSVQLYKLNRSTRKSCQRLTRMDSTNYVVQCLTSGNDLGPIYESVDPFNRIADPGLINVKNLKSPEEMRELYPFPAAKVKDLRATEISFEDQTVTLQWTSVGDFAGHETGRGDHME